MKSALIHCRYAIVILMGFLICCGKSGQLITRLSTSKGYLVEIFAEEGHSSDVTVLMLRYMVKSEQGAGMIVPCTFGYLHKDVSKLHFKVIETKDHDIVGVIEESMPEEIVILFQPSKGFYWPNVNWHRYEGGILDWKGYLVLSESITTQLANDHRNSNLELGDYGLAVFYDE